MPHQFNKVVFIAYALIS